VKRVIRGILFLLGGGFVFVVGYGLYSYLSGSPPVAAPVTVHWHTGTEKPAILFLHGLGGDVYETWQNADSSFMKLMARDKAFADYAIASVQYPTNVFGDTPTIAQLAKKLASYLDEELPDNRQIVIIAHSLGGIIARQALVESDLQGRQHQSVTLITLGTPFDGSDLPNLTAGLAALKVTSKQMDALGASSEMLQVYESNWTGLLRRCGSQIREFAASEGQPTNGVQVVSRHSATKNIRSEQTFHSAEDNHLTIAKPTSLDSPIGRAVREWTLDAFRKREYQAGTWTISKDLEIPPEGSLTLHPGAKLDFRKGARLIAKGRIEAKGTEAEPIIFDFDQTSGAAGAIVLRGVDASQSQFTYCRFQHGNGVGVDRPRPGRHSNAARQELYSEKETLLTTSAKRAGGAVLLVGTSNVIFTKCHFEDNEAYQGGALALLGSERIQINNCRFIRNRSTYGGGAIFAQASDLYITAGSAFEWNQSGDITAPEGAPERDACGGAVYLGFGARADMRDIRFANNVTSNAGGAIYIYDTHPAAWQGGGTNQLLNLKFVQNRSHRAEGGAVRSDGMTSTHLIDPVFEDNTSGLDTPAGGVALRVASKGTFQVTNPQWRRNGQPYAEQYRLAAADVPAPGRMVVREPMRNKQAYKAMDQRLIDTVVIHAMSAGLWSDPEFRARYPDEVRTIEAQPEMHALINDPAAWRSDWRLCKAILELEGRSVHYLIARDGKIHQLVEDKDIAFHATAVSMPEGDDRSNVDDFSLGVALMGFGPDDSDLTASASAPAFTAEQYDALDDLLLQLAREHGLAPKNIVTETVPRAERMASLPSLVPSVAGGAQAGLFDWRRINERLIRHLRDPARIAIERTSDASAASRTRGL
jgi:predicted outer membrane repeat protein